MLNAKKKGAQYRGNIPQSTTNTAQHVYDIPSNPSCEVLIAKGTQLYSIQLSLICPFHTQPSLIRFRYFPIHFLTSLWILAYAIQVRPTISSNYGQMQQKFPLATEESTTEDKNFPLPSCGIFRPSLFFDMRIDVPSKHLSIKAAREQVAYRAFSLVPCRGTNHTTVALE